MWVTDRQSHGEVVKETSPRSYIVQTPEGVFHRNRRQIITSPEKILYPQLEMPEEESISTETGTMTGTLLYHRRKCTRPGLRVDILLNLQTDMILVGPNPERGM